LTALGWRGVAALGISPGILAILVAIFVPESPRWLVAKGRFVQARETVAWILGMRAVDLPLQTSLPAIPPRARLGELYVRPGLFWMTAITWCGAATGVYGVILWGPTVFSMLLKIPVRQAAEYFVYVSACGICGKLVFSFLPHWIGRKRAGILHGIGMAIMLTLAGYYHSVYIAGFPLFVVLVIASDFFLDGGFANLAPYPVEAYGVRLGARASGLAQAANGVGKLLGPIALALIAGTTNLVSPHATEQAIFPAFLFLAACGVAIALSFAFLGYETNGRPIANCVRPRRGATRPEAGSPRRSGAPSGSPDLDRNADVDRRGDRPAIIQGGKEAPPLQGRDQRRIETGVGRRLKQCDRRAAIGGDAEACHRDDGQLAMP
jgi:putative MFS transporter